jgi:glyoxylase-like metal-dependent hydrolase (beta-lactamase superfamily II)
MNGEVVELEDGIRRITFRLPLGIDHVHCYLLRASDGTWTAVDAGLGLPDVTEHWQRVVEQLDAPVSRIVITHFHPDHVGASADLAELTGATVHQSPLDYAQCIGAWGGGRRSGRFPDHVRSHGLPEEEVESLRRDSQGLAGLVRFARDPEPLGEGDVLDGWTIVALPGHADGHIALLRDGILIAGDTILGTISPTVGLYPDSRPDPLADYLTSLERIEHLAPERAYAGHGDPIGDPAARARDLVAHHDERLEQTKAAARGAPRTAYEISLDLFPEPLNPVGRRFALAESAAHLEYLARRNTVSRNEQDGRILYGG